MNFAETSSVYGWWFKMNHGESTHNGRRATSIVFGVKINGADPPGAFVGLCSTRSPRKRAEVLIVYICDDSVSKTCRAWLFTPSQPFIGLRSGHHELLGLLICFKRYRPATRRIPERAQYPRRTSSWPTQTSCDKRFETCFYPPKVEDTWNIREYISMVNSQHSIYEESSHLGVYRAILGIPAAPQMGEVCMQRQAITKGPPPRRTTSCSQLSSASYASFMFNRCHKTGRITDD
ncbi:hypothetical protein BJ170DRAFT_590661 [Xylariales sp. AK1849]|nr:hypothetical protein BJ170DRAFT_590661 [Xylariales sp. AK1849]